MFGGIAGEEAEGRRKDDIVAKGGSGEKTQGGEDGKGQENPLFMAVQTGRDEAPYLPKDNRTGEQNAAAEGDFQIKKKPSW